MRSGEGSVSSSRSFSSNACTKDKAVPLIIRTFFSDQKLMSSSEALGS